MLPVIVYDYEHANFPDPLVDNTWLSNLSNVNVRSCAILSTIQSHAERTFPLPLGVSVRAGNRTQARRADAIILNY